jgi:hypothetical protein
MTLGGLWNKKNELITDYSHGVEALFLARAFVVVQLRYGKQLLTPITRQYFRAGIVEDLLIKRDRAVDIFEEELQIGEPLARAILRYWEAIRDLWRGVGRPEPGVVGSVEQQLSHQVADKDTQNIVSEVLGKRSKPLAQDSQ